MYSFISDSSPDETTETSGLTASKKLFVFTNSGQRDLKEAYSFMIDENGNVERKNVVIK